MFNETMLGRMQNIITMKMVKKSTHHNNNISFKYLGQDTSERNRAVVRDITGNALLMN